MFLATISFKLSLIYWSQSETEVKKHKFEMDSASSRTVLLGIVFLLVASMVAVNGARTIVVGDSEGWRSGTNYTDWSIKNSPMYINDILGQ